MPISATDGYPQEHWSDVLEIIEDSIETAGFKPNLVSNADDVGIIQKRIIQNLYENPVVVCDVSAKNPNVMFELGLRLAFDKPTIIIKDDQTSYSFDTAPIEHISYPRDLRYADIVEFKQTLSDKIASTYKRATDDSNYTTFLKNFGTFTVAKLETKEVDKEDFILDELKSIRQLVLARSVPAAHVPQASKRPKNQHVLCLQNIDLEAAESVASTLCNEFGITGFAIDPGNGTRHFHIRFDGDVSSQSRALVDAALKTVEKARWLGANGVVVYKGAKKASS